MTRTFQQYGRFVRPQTSYWGELMGYYQAGDVLMKAEEEPFQPHPTTWRL